MSQGVELDLKQLVLFDGAFGPREIMQIAGGHRQRLLAIPGLARCGGRVGGQGESDPATGCRLGACLYLLGRYDRAIEVLKNADGGALAQFYLGKASSPREPTARPPDRYDAAERGGYNSDDVALAKAEAAALLVASGRRPGAAGQAFGRRGANGRVSLPARGHGGQDRRQSAEVVALYERAVEADRNHAGALFGLALENDRHGNDNTALELYKRSAGQFPSHVGALLNLGILYEDREQYDRAAGATAGVGHLSRSSPGAMYLPDAEASGDQYYDEDAAEEARSHEPGVEHSGDRLRAVGPQPQLPAEDGRDDAGRPVPLHRAGTAGQQELRRNQPRSRSRKCWPPRACGWGNWPPNGT